MVSAVCVALSGVYLCVNYNLRKAYYFVFDFPWWHDNYAFVKTTKCLDSVFVQKRSVSDLEQKELSSHSVAEQ
jgi:hypothetical protein